MINLNLLSLSELAILIETNWPKVSSTARPYLDAMKEIATLKDYYGADSGDTIVIYFLSNATTWRGEAARTIKAELNHRLSKHT